MDWTQTLRDLIATGDYSTQTALVEALSAKGYAVNQATVSRALRRIGAHKVSGAYRLGRRAVAAVRGFRVTAGGCLVVLTTDPAFASILAQRIDLTEHDGVLGTIAGDDTVFGATTGPEALPRL
ncbi:MAG: transcriptional regulator of arginine metabolism, partial [Myxococcota bacterium]